MNDGGRAGQSTRCLFLFRPRADLSEPRAKCRAQGQPETNLAHGSRQRTCLDHPMPWPRNKGLPGFPCQFDPFAVCLARCIPSFCQHPRNTSCNQPALSDCPRCPFIRHSLPLLFHRTHANSRRYRSPLPKNKEFRYLVQLPVRIPYAQACQRPASLAPVPPPSLHALSAPPGPGGRGDCDGHSFAGFLFPTL